MKRSGHQQVKTRESKVFRFLQCVTLFWVIAVASFFVGGVFSRPSPLLVGSLVALSAATLLAWWWGIRTVRIQNAAGKTIEEIRALAPDAFEEWVGARFRDAGYSVKLTATQGDHGIDLIAEKPGETAVIQCKNYRAWSVGEPVVRDLFGAMHDFGADRAYLVTAGRLSRPAAKWVLGKPIEVWDGEVLAGLSMQGTAPRSGAKPGHLTSSASSPDDAPAMSHRCPKCGAQLVKRQNRRSGEPFLGCSIYPACRHTQPWPADGDR